MITNEKGCSGSPFSHVLSFHNSFLYISNITDIFTVVQKIISWKAGESELICLYGGLHFHRIGRMAKTLDLFWDFPYCISAFRSRKVVVSFPPPEKRKISADIRSECLYGFEVMDFGYCSCG